jgi:hypothetical protein
MCFTHQYGGTHVCKSLAAFLASTVLPRSVASFRMRAFTGSLSVTATLTSLLRDQLMFFDLATHGDICSTLAAGSVNHDIKTDCKQLLEVQWEAEAQRFTSIVDDTIPAALEQDFLAVQAARNQT